MLDLYVFENGSFSEQLMVLSNLTYDYLLQKVEILGAFHVIVRPFDERSVGDGYDLTAKQNASFDYKHLHDPSKQVRAAEEDRHDIQRPRVCRY